MRSFRNKDVKGNIIRIKIIVHVKILMFTNYINTNYNVGVVATVFYCVLQNTEVP